ncbi:uncharacterized protein DUF2515 [Paenibacillus cellulosilyticus]|uniref:Uncharacterized protein DUF2515 n=1 Tax=Paenibacillus cellulosilyticus TaxID=375489 RepID=A0A2V2YYA2_9BACL|nr:DUF2515 domain-containing protein [Paenibacillus cellulosilyticus]PWW06251.1 uncharacterized protein DUF2515 [Paenibacillus cellulosilyticus]QKS42996.1 DUF2515 domain-containing protein [Paenibacillus cellulosilyticus]
MCVTNAHRRRAARLIQGGAARRLGAAAAAAVLRVLRLPIDAVAYAIRYAVGKWRAMSASQTMAASASILPLDQPLVAALTASWRKLEHPQQMLAESSLSAADRTLLDYIRGETARLNRNNVTRTIAYLAMYERRPELHWALLAHMVSRNGGWNMTDLQGEWLPRLLSERKRDDIFLFLERANALIFGDAYPQLLLYEHSVRIRRPLFHLLPLLRVSCFMQPVWEQFWTTRNSTVLTVALIVNEQNYIESRVVQHPYYRKNVIDTLFFGMQSLLQLNAILLPYAHGQKPQELRLAGLILERFSSLYERIEIGKRLYALLFAVPRIGEGVAAFARSVRHTGSRADYAPHLFERLRERPPQVPYKERLLGGQLKAGSERPYSPALADAWPDQKIEPAEPGDWFTKAADVVSYFERLPLPNTFEMTNEYGFLLDKLELAAAASFRPEAEVEEELREPGPPSHDHTIDMRP